MHPTPLIIHTCEMDCKHISTFVDAFYNLLVSNGFRRRGRRRNSMFTFSPATSIFQVNIPVFCNSLLPLMPIRSVTTGASCAGKINLMWLMLLVAGGVSLALVAMLRVGTAPESNDVEVIQVLCAAGLRPAMEEVGRRYEEEYGVEVRFNSGGSNTLLSQIKINKFDESDLYLAADDFFTDQAVGEGLAAEVLPIAYMRPVIAVPKGNPQGIETIEDLLAEHIRISMGDPEQTAIGKAVKKRLSPAGDGEENLWQKLEAHIRSTGVFKPTVNDSALDVKANQAADAAIVWDSTVAMPQYRDHLTAIPVPELDGDPNLVSICVLNSSRNPTAALKFARYVSAVDRGLQVFEEFGTRPVAGDVWEERPEISFFCGAVNRRAVESIVDEFEKREGVQVNDKYLGCGTLTGNMELIADQRTDLGFPDIYMACDVYYLENVKQWFQEAELISETEIVMAVPKGSDKVQSLADLIAPGVRVAIGEPKQCTIGALTRRLLVDEGLYDQLKHKQRDHSEVVVEFDSSANLVPQVVRIGNESPADVALAYITDVQANADRVDVIHIDSPLNKAIQPLAIAKSSFHKHLARRLFKKIVNSPEAFEEAGFHFRLDDSATDESTGS